MQALQVPFDLLAGVVKEQVEIAGIANTQFNIVRQGTTKGYWRLLIHPWIGHLNRRNHPRKSGDESPCHLWRRIGKPQRTSTHLGQTVSRYAVKSEVTIDRMRFRHDDIRDEFV